MGNERMRRLEPLVGAWTVTMITPDGSRQDDYAGTMTFEWVLGGQFLVQQGTVAHPQAPDMYAVIGTDPRTDDGYVQHYFDSRGVTRIMEMTFDGTRWTLAREKPDFSDFNFSQRWTGTFSEDGDTIVGTFEIAHDHKTYEKDFDVVYTRVSG